MIKPQTLDGECRPLKVVANYQLQITSFRSPGNGNYFWKLLFKNKDGLLKFKIRPKLH